MSDFRKQFGRAFLFVLFLAAPALAQFEIEPDHPDDADEHTSQSRTMQLNQEIAQQQAILEDCRAQIRAKAELVDMAQQSLLLTGAEAGEAEALAIYQRDLEKLKKALAPIVRAAETKLAQLQGEQAQSAKLRPAEHAVPHPVKHLKHRAVVASARSGS